MHAESAAVSISRMRRTVVRAAAMLALVAAQQRLDAGGLVYGRVGLTSHPGLDVELTHLSGAGSAMPHARVRRYFCLSHIRRGGSGHGGSRIAPA